MKYDKPEPLAEAMAMLAKKGYNPYRVCESLADEIADLMLAKDERAESCLRFVADTYLHTGCNVTRLAIENCFLYRLGDRIFCSPNHARLLKALPDTLHDILMRQMTATGP